MQLLPKNCLINGTKLCQLFAAQNESFIGDKNTLKTENAEILNLTWKLQESAVLLAANENVFIIKNFVRAMEKVVRKWNSIDRNNLGWAYCCVARA